MAIGLSPLPAEARDTGSTRIDISAGTLRGAIAELAREQGVSIGTEGSLPDLRTPAVRGSMTIDKALKRLLRNSGYVARKVGPRAWRIERAPPPKRKRSAPVPPRQTQPAPAPSEAPGAIAPEVLIVTATKREADFADVPLSLTVVRFDGETPATVTDGSGTVAAAVEGLSLSGLGPGRNRMFLRGVSDSAFTGENQSTVAVILDESRITYSAPDPDLRLVDVKRVELIKGPQGSLYGTGALGGIYRIVTNAPELDESSIAVSASSEAVASGAIGYSASVAANLPLAPNLAAFRLVGYSGTEAGWIETGDRPNSNRTRVLGGRAMLALEPAPGWRADLTAAIQLLDSRDTQYVYAPRVREREAQLPEPHDNDLSHFALRVAGEIGFIRLQANSGITWHEVRDQLDATLGATQFGLVDPQVFVDDRKFRVWDSELRASGSLGTGNWLLGISHIEARQSLAVSLADAAGTTLALDDDRRTSSDSAIFADASVPLGDAVMLEVGGRLFSSSTSETRLTDVGLVSRTIRKRGITPSLALSWKPNEDRLLFVRYGSAFRQGGAEITREGTFNPLNSDELATFEIGWRETFPGGGSASLGAYYSVWENIQSDLLQPDGLLESASVGDGEILGLEATAELPLRAGWQLTFGAAYTDAQLVQFEAGVPDADARLPVVPEYTLRARLRRDFTLAGLSLQTSIGVRYLGPARLSFDPLIDQPMGNVLETDLAVRLKLAETDIEIAIENLLDNRQNVFAYGNPLRLASSRQYTPQTPLSGRISIRHQF